MDNENKYDDGDHDDVGPTNGKDRLCDENNNNGGDDKDIDSAVFRWTHLPLAEPSTFSSIH